MERINFDVGLKTYALNDDETKVIRFLPSDLNLPNRMKKAVTEIENYTLPSNDDIENMTSADAFIKEQINFMFGNDICTVAFGDINCLSPVNGIPLFQRFLDAIIPIMKKDIAAEQKKSQTKINNYVSQVKK